MAESRVRIVMAGLYKGPLHIGIRIPIYKFIMRKTELIPPTSKDVLMPALTAYANTENTSLVILEQKGYRTWYDENMEMFGYEKNGWDFLANSVTELLGVVGIYEHHGKPKKYKEYWWQINEPWLIENVPTQKPKFKPIWEM